MPVTFSAVVEVPSNTGQVVAAEWDFEGRGEGVGQIRLLAVSRQTMKHETGAVLFTINLQSLATFYERVVDMRVLHTEDDQIRLEAGSFRLTVHQIPERYAKNITIEKPPVVREATAIKLAFRVKDIAKARETAAQLGGLVYSSDREWQHDGSTICDGYDSDGNVFQLWQ